jgi:hypothetical protein
VGVIPGGQKQAAALMAVAAEEHGTGDRCGKAQS